MSGTRSGAVARAKAIFDDGTYLAELKKLVAVPTESQLPSRLPELDRYSRDVVGPLLAKLGFEIAIFENPRPKCGPIMLASRIEGAARPTALSYGHGDVVRGLDDKWKKGLSPWQVTVDGDRLYGRGTADNKGQHLVIIEALRAVIEERGSLGFNSKVLIEMGEEVGSPGLEDFLRQRKELCTADVFIASDGPRQASNIPEMRLGARGGIAFDVIARLRDNAHHSGHWGGVLSDPGFIMAHALASMVGPTGKILVEGWTPPSIPDAVRRICNDIVFEELPDLPEVDPNWGEPGLSKAEKIFAWTSVVVLAFLTGHPDAPTNAVQGEARARVQVRHTVDIDGDTIVPALRRHLDKHGFKNVRVEQDSSRDMFPASRTDPNNPWVQMIGKSMQRTTNRSPNIVPNSSGGNPSRMFLDILGTPVIWIPHSYAACSQHAPNEHALGSLVREGLGLMAALWWDIGSGETPARRSGQV
jgi:acetylornithine deacetylase/succinyl-diaminopimelate desuccinylase-like protein